MVSFVRFCFCSTLAHPPPPPPPACLLQCWVARQPSGFAFLEFEDERDAEDAIKALDGGNLKGEPLQVQMSRNQGKGPNDAGSRKPGDWLCPQCKVNNFARRDECFRCQTVKPRDAGWEPRGGGGGYGYGGGGGGGYGRDRYDDRYDDRRRYAPRPPPSRLLTIVCLRVPLRLCVHVCV
jgi:RNA recognition motif-containing protein